MSTPGVTLEDMRSIDLFDDLSDEDLEVWRAAAIPDSIEPGETITDAEVEPRGVALIFEGTLESILPTGLAAAAFRHQEAPTWSLAIAVMTGADSPVKMQALTPCRFAWVESKTFRDLAFEYRPVLKKVIGQMGPVYQRQASMAQNRERMESLGTMSAGLAHELNNPAAAAQRASQQLEEILETISLSLGKFVESGVEREQAGRIMALQQQAYNWTGERCSVSAYAAAEAEDKLLEQLEDLGVEKAWEIAGPLAEAGVDDQWLAEVVRESGPFLTRTLSWIAATLSARVLVNDVQSSTNQISDLVGAIKAYSFMDRGELANADIHQGINSTLKILHHKFKNTDIEIVRDFQDDIPEMQVRGSELNQVWTNLLDNAISALGDKGTITIRTFTDATCIQVDITDDGPGISEEDQKRIFDTFYTTKGVGEGTGLGLSTAHRIVEELHKGSLWVDSKPGETTFHVRMPFDQN